MTSNPGGESLAAADTVARLPKLPDDQLPRVEGRESGRADTLAAASESGAVPTAMAQQQPAAGGRRPRRAVDPHRIKD
jgi:hypothetical protein